MHKKNSTQEQKWNLTPLYRNLKEWEKELSKMVQEAKGGWPRVKKSDNLKDADTVKEIFDGFYDYSRKLEKLYTYAHLLHDQNMLIEESKSAYEQVSSLVSDFSLKMAWIDPEILTLSSAQIDALVKDEKLSLYRRHLERLKEQKEHVLSTDKEEILALSQKMQSAPQKAFSEFNNADIHFPEAIDKEGKAHSLTHGTYLLYMKSEDRTLRKSAFINVHQTFGHFHHTCTELLRGEMETHIFTRKVRRYKSCTEAALKTTEIPIKVYDTLIDTVRKHISSLHQYVKIRKKGLQLEELHYYDLFVPMVSGVDRKFTYEEAANIVVESVACLGKDYQEVLRAGLFEHGWVDVYESKGKRTGAYSSGCYDSYPYILLNFHGTISDVLTLSHEAGHSMHSYLSRTTQKYPLSGYPIFLAEVASTFHEKLTYEYLIEKAKSKKEKLYLLNQQIDGIRSTFYRQTMFAEFERDLHDHLDRDLPLTFKTIEDKYLALNRFYFGPDFIIDPELAYEAFRIPHFYYNLYVYQYATGIAAAYHLVEVVKKKGADNYKKFLKGGSSQKPLDLLKMAGIDMEKKEPIETIMQAFQDLTSRLKKELEEN